MKIKNVAVILPLCILLVAACTCSSTAPEPEPATPDVQIITENLSCEEISEGFFKCRCYLTGTVKNIGDVDAEWVVVRAEFFDAYGERSGYSTDVLGDLLRVGESASYSIKDEERDQCPSTYEVWAEWEEPGGFCFIATAAYGTSAAEELDTLRAFRDEVLLENRLGSQFVDWYYQTSPPVADFISKNSLLRTIVRELAIDPMVSVATFTQGMWGK